MGTMSMGGMGSVSTIGGMGQAGGVGQVGTMGGMNQGYGAMPLNTAYMQYTVPAPNYTTIHQQPAYVSAFDMLATELNEIGQEPAK